MSDVLTGGWGLVLIVAAAAVALALEVIDERTSGQALRAGAVSRPGTRVRRRRVLRLALVVLVVASVADTAVRLVVLAS